MKHVNVQDNEVRNCAYCYVSDCTSVGLNQSFVIIVVESNGRGFSVGGSFLRTLLMLQTLVLSEELLLVVR